MKKLVSLILIIFLGFTLYSTLIFTNNKLEKKNIKKNIKEIEAKIKKMNKENNELKVGLDKIEDENNDKKVEYNIWLKAKEKLEK